MKEDQISKQTTIWGNKSMAFVWADNLYSQLSRKKDELTISKPLFNLFLPPSVFLTKKNKQNKIDET